MKKKQRRTYQNVTGISMSAEGTLAHNCIILLKQGPLCFTTGSSTLSKRTLSLHNNRRNPTSYFLHSGSPSLLLLCFLSPLSVSSSVSISSTHAAGLSIAFFTSQSGSTHNQQLRVRMISYWFFISFLSISLLFFPLGLSFVPSSFLSRSVYLRSSIINSPLHLHEGGALYQQLRVRMNYRAGTRRHIVPKETRPHLHTKRTGERWKEKGRGRLHNKRNADNEKGEKMMGAWRCDTDNAEG